ncbi:MAG: ferritin [Ignavibacteriaceae bacterium]|nr:ferritin [Ignavibacteriaceae bacterium]
MLKSNIEKALNEQINKELFSSYLYLSMGNYFESINLSGFAGWMRLQSQEEYQHAMKILNYVNQKGGRVVLQQIADPKIDWESVVSVFEDTYEHEKMISGSINDIVDLSLGEKDYATHTFLQWFVNEQVEEEATALKILEDVKMIGDYKAGLFMMDRELGQRAPETEEA